MSGPVMIVMDEAGADAVRGPTAPGHALEPLLLADGETWVLPLSVLADPAHAARHDVLAAMAQREIDDAEWPEREPEGGDE